MIELRWVDWGISQELEYRYQIQSLTVLDLVAPSWSEWRRVPAVMGNVAYPPKPKAEGLAEGPPSPKGEHQPSEAGGTTP